MRLKCSNLKKTTRLSFQNLVFSLAKNRYFVVVAFKMLKMEFKFKYTMLMYESVNRFSQFTLVKIKKISGSISGKVKKIEAQAK